MKEKISEVILFTIVLVHSPRGRLKTPTISINALSSIERKQLKLKGTSRLSTSTTCTVFHEKNYRERQSR